MGRKKKRGRRAASMLSPVDRRGIKLATLVTEAGIALAAHDAYVNMQAGNHQEAAASFLRVTDPNHLKGKLFWTGIAMKIAGKYVPELKYMGPVGFR